MVKKYKVIYDVWPKPSPVEITAAEKVAEYLRVDIHFLQQGVLKTADTAINGTRWEIKRQEGSSGKGVDNLFREAGKQAGNLIFDGRASKLHPEKLRHRVGYCLNKSKTIKRVLFINKRGEIAEIQKVKRKGH